MRTKAEVIADIRAQEKEVCDRQCLVDEINKLKVQLDIKQRMYDQGDFTSMVGQDFHAELALVVLAEEVQ